jgi:hypothetical protein
MPERKTAPGRRHPQAGSTSNCWLIGSVCAVSEESVLAGTYLTWPDAPAAYRRAVKLHLRSLQISLSPPAKTTVRLRAIRGAVAAAEVALKGFPRSHAPATSRGDCASRARAARRRPPAS